MMLRLFLPCALLSMFTLPAFGQSKSKKDIPPPIELTGSATRTDVFPLENGDQILQFNNPDRQDKPKDKPVPSRIRIFIPGNVEKLKGMIFDLGYTYTPDRSDLQKIAREEGWAIVGCLLRYAYGTELLDRALADFAEKSGHPELIDLPIIPMGFSRNGARAWDFAEENPNRTVALALGGNPGNAARWDKNPARLDLARTVPVLTLVGSKDPFVNYDKTEDRYWHIAVYPRIREKEGIPWGMMIGWGYRHNWEGSWTPFTMFFQECFRLRVPATPAADGVVDLKPLPFADGWLAEYGWMTDWPEIAPVAQFKGDASKAIWLPSEAMAEVWRAFEVKEPEVELTVAGDEEFNELRVTAPENTKSVEYFSGATSLGSTDQAPYTLKVPTLEGVQTVFAVATTPDGKTPSRPTTVVQGAAIDWTVGDADQKRAEQPENVVLLTPELRATLVSALSQGGTPPSPEQKEALVTRLRELQNDTFVEQRSAATKVLEALGEPPK